MTAGFPRYEPYAKSLISTLAGTGISAEVVGCGLCGLTAVEMARGLDSPQLQDLFGRVGPGLRKLLLEEGPFDLVIIMAGTNDVAMPHISPDEVLASLKNMHAACWEAGAPTVALSVPESSVTGTTQYPQAAQKWHAVNDALDAWAKAEQGERSLTSPFFVNSATLVSFDDAARARGIWDQDSLHFTDVGSAEFGSKLAPIIASHLQGPTKCPNSVFKGSTEESFSTEEKLVKGIKGLAKFIKGKLGPSSKRSQSELQSRIKDCFRSQNEVKSKTRQSVKSNRRQRSSSRTKCAERPGLVDL
jgi:hypothetical protein